MTRPRAQSLILAAALLLSCGGAGRAFAQKGAAWEKSDADGEAAAQQKKYDEAERHHLEALGHAEKFGARDPRLIATLTKLAAAYENQQKFVEAEGAYRRAVESAGKLAEAKDSPYAQAAPDLLAACLEKLADFYRARQKFAEAEQAYRGAVDALSRPAAKQEKTPRTQDEWMGFMMVAMSGGGKVRLADVSDKLATLFLVQNKLADAEKFYQLSVETQEAIPRTGESAQFAATLENLAVTYARQGRYAEAEPHFRRALQIFEQTLGWQHRQVTATMENYALLLRKLGRESDAEAMLARAKSIREKLK